MSSKVKPRTVYQQRRIDKEDDGTDIHVGSTTQKLSDRLTQHRSVAKQDGITEYITECVK